MSVRWDVLGIGCASVDELLYVDEFPIPDAKTPVIREDRQCGGLTATALVAAARFGATCCYAGVLGTDSTSDFVADSLLCEGIDLSLVSRLFDARPVHSRIIVDTKRNTRTIFFSPGKLVGPHPTLVIDEAIWSSRVLFVDHSGGSATVRAICAARDAGIPIVADIEADDQPGFKDIMSLVDHLIVSEQFALRTTGAYSVGQAVCHMMIPGRSVVIVTCGSSGCWFMENGDPEARHFPAFPVVVSDTTGCGDVFHGVYAACLSLDMAVLDRIRFASAAAAIKATRDGAQRGIPTRSQIDEFLLRSQNRDDD